LVYIVKARPDPKIDPTLAAHYLELPCGGGCSAEAADLACKILDLQEAGKIWLKPEHFNPIGNDPYDGASALDNIKDTCEGKQVRRWVELLKAAESCLYVID
jgi:hypothetical protein